MNQEPIINQKEYLKRYLSGKNKKKRKKKEKVTGGRLNVIDDDVDVFTQELNDDNLESEDAPQIVAVFDERPPSMQVDEKTKATLWKPIGDIITIKEENDSDEEKPKIGVQFKMGPNRENNDDNSPPRRRNDDNSPPRRRRGDSSPPRRRNNDNSPPRRRNDDQSPLRRKNDDHSPPRRRNNDNSPPRRRNVDSSPLRRRRNDSPRRNNQEKLSKTTRNRSRSPPHKKRRSKSPEFRNKSPPIQRKSPRRKTRFSSPTIPEPSGNQSLNSSPPRKRQHKSEKTLDGKKAGLQNANDLAVESQQIREKENEMFAKMSADISGKGATTVVRNRKPEEDPVEVAKRLQREKEMKDKYDKWGKGLKQVDDQKDKMEQELYEMSKPLARYADDEDLERYLKEQEREGDPMLAYIRKKKRKEQVDAGVKLKPQYEGEFLPNRFGIRPGCRWDGVDRSNGYEKKWFDVQNAKKAQQDETYKWSTEDM